MTGSGRWQRVLLDALTQAELVGVAAAVDRHLGRRATRAELNAARRTAAHLAADGRVTLHQVRIQPGQDAGGGVLLVIAQPGAELDDDRLRQAARGRTPAAQDPAAAERERQAAVQHVARAVAGLEQAAEDARTVDVDHLQPQQAARLADQLTAALGEVTTLQRRLHRRSRPPATTHRIRAWRESDVNRPVEK